MEILFDNGVPKKLRQHFHPHRVSRTQEIGFDDLVNGELLRAAQKSFDILITTDSNIEYQQRLPEYEIALMVLRAERIKYELYLPLVPQMLTDLTSIQPGEVRYYYTERAAEIDRRKGKYKGR